MTATTQLLPPGASALERGLSEVTQCTERGVVPEQIAKLWDPQTCPEPLLPWLAWALSVDEWDESWPSETKRALIARSVPIHKHKGTVGSVKRALSSLGLELEFFEWFEDTDDVYLAPYLSKEPHTFVFIAWANALPYTSRAIKLDQALYDAIYRVTNQTKPQKAHFDFLVGMKMASHAAAGAIVHPITHKRMYAAVEPCIGDKAKQRDSRVGLSMAANLSRTRYQVLRHHAEVDKARHRGAHGELPMAANLSRTRYQVLRQVIESAKVRRCHWRGALGQTLSITRKPLQVVRFRGLTDQRIPDHFINSTSCAAPLLHISRRRVSAVRCYGTLGAST
ncbi:phage tail protein I [Pseudoalteromonas sp. DL2-H2.2]|uniref:phage tail protein I n=1 Tax=Pseudoalteromonas sp. DL2-H2.2 TaxID=2908889 RepID=UPI001F386601|nr:phage tail protein I [Pseudoalteromonas sp. DL2-H2.2]MCF2910086.1 phage tail protein I [Pseudoalteromonas sp. DL2-H2.2]